MGNLPVEKLQRATSVIRRAYSGPGMKLAHLWRRVQQLAPAVDAKVRPKLTEEAVGRWHGDNAEKNTPKLASEEAKPFHIPDTDAGRKDGRYMKRRPAWDAALEKLWSDGNTFGAKRLWFALKQQRPGLRVGRGHVARWLQTREAWSTHKQWRRDKTVYRRHALGANRVLGVDLKDQQHAAFPRTAGANAYKYVLVTVCHWSRKVYTRALRDKTGPTVAAAMTQIFAAIGHPVGAVQADAGSEFTSQQFRAACATNNNTKLYFVSVGAPWSNGVAERIMGQLAKAFDIRAKEKTGAAGKNWPAFLPKWTKLLNTSYNTALGGISPDQAVAAYYAAPRSAAQQAIVDRVNRQFQSRAKDNADNVYGAAVYSEGDLVRVRLEDMAGGVNFSREPFTVSAVQLNRQGRDPDTQSNNYVARYQLKRARDVSGDADYAWDPSGMLVPELTTLLQDRGLSTAGNRAAKIARLQGPMQAEINDPDHFVEPYALSGLRKAELQALAQPRGIPINQTVALLKAALQPVLDQELKDTAVGWYKNDQLAPYKAPDGTRAGAGGFEKGPREFVLQYLQKPAYTATGQRGFLCA